MTVLALFQVEQMRAQLRFVELGWIALHARGQLAHIAHILLLCRARQRTEFKRLRKAEQRIGIVERHLRGVLLGGFM